MTRYCKRNKIFWIIFSLPLIVSGCLGFQAPTQDRKGYFQKKEYIFRSLESQMNVVEEKPLLLADVTINNPTNYSIQTLQLTCVEISQGGHHLGKHAPVLNHVLQEKSQETFRGIEIGPSHSQFGSLQCEVTDFEIVGLQPKQDTSGAGLIQKSEAELGETNSGSKVFMTDEGKTLPASTSTVIPERRIRDGNDLQDSVTRPKANQLSSRQKADLVLRLLRGESLESVSRDSRVSVYDLERWQRIFLEGGRQGLENTK